MRNKGVEQSTKLPGLTLQEELTLIHGHRSQMLLWLDYTDLESLGMKCLSDNNRKQIKSPKKGIRRNEKQKELQGKVKAENFNLTPKQSRCLRFCWQLTHIQMRFFAALLEV